MSFQDFSLIPADDPQSSPVEDFAAAAEGALAIADEPTPITEDAPAPFGNTWAFDWQSGQFLRSGQAPLPVGDLDTVAEWCLMAMHSARYAHPVFSDEFGIERPESVIGSLADDEVLADWQANLVDALLVHERITAVENISLFWDPSDGTLYVLSMDVITDEDRTVTISNVSLSTGGL